MNFKFSQSINIRDFSSKVKECLEESSQVLESAAEKVFRARISMDLPDVTYQDVGAALHEAKAITDSASEALESHILSIIEFQKLMQSIQSQQDQQGPTAPPSHETEFEGGENEV